MYLFRIFEGVSVGSQKFRINSSYLVDKSGNLCYNITGVRFAARGMRLERRRERNVI